MKKYKRIIDKKYIKCVSLHKLLKGYLIKVN